MAFKTKGPILPKLGRPAKTVTSDDVRAKLTAKIDEVLPDLLTYPTIDKDGCQYNPSSDYFRHSQAVETLRMIDMVASVLLAIDGQENDCEIEPVQPGIVEKVKS